MRGAASAGLASRLLWVGCLAAAIVATGGLWQRERQHIGLEPLKAATISRTADAKPPPHGTVGCLLGDNKTHTAVDFKLACQVNILAMPHVTSGGFCCAYRDDWKNCSGPACPYTNVGHGVWSGARFTTWSGGQKAEDCFKDPFTEASAPGHKAQPAFCGVIGGGSGGSCTPANVSGARQPKIVSVYIDKVSQIGSNETGLIEALKNMARSGVTHTICAFWLTQEAGVDMAGAFAAILPASKVRLRQDLAAIAAQRHTAPMAIMVSSFGASEDPVTAPVNGSNDGAAVGARYAQYAIDNGFDGADIDFEDGGSFLLPNHGPDAATYPSTGEKFVGDMTTAMRATFTAASQQGQAAPYGGTWLISHAPQSPYCIAPWNYVYRRLDYYVGKHVDFYNFQFYNQMASTWVACASLHFRAHQLEIPSNTPLWIIMRTSVPAIPTHTLQYPSKAHYHSWAFGLVPLLDPARAKAAGQSYIFDMTARGLFLPSTSSPAAYNAGQWLTYPPARCLLLLSGALGT